MPIVKAAQGAATLGLGEEAPIKQQLARMAADSPEMKAAAQAFARRVEIKQALLLKLYEPLAKWAGASRDYFADDFAEDMAKKVDGIPEEELSSPSPSVAVPAMQGLGYSLSEPELKEMYLNLLATATDGRRQDEAHPSFAEVIKQLSASETGILNSVLRVSGVPIVILKRSVSTGGFNTLHRNFTDLRNTKTGDPIVNPLVASWIDNWARLGLVSVDFGHFLSDSGRYDWVERRPEFEALVAERPDSAVTFDKGVLTPTDFGLRFAKAVGVAAGA